MNWIHLKPGELPKEGRRLLLVRRGHKEPQLGRHNGEMFEVDARGNDIGVGVRDVTHWAYVKTPIEQCTWHKWEDLDARCQRQARHRFPHTKEGAHYHFRWGVDEEGNVVFRLDPEQPDEPEHYAQD